MLPLGQGEVVSTGDLHLTEQTQVTFLSSACKIEWPQSKLCIVAQSACGKLVSLSASEGADCGQFAKSIPELLSQ